MPHPSCCPNPDTCTLTYRDHLVGFGVAAAAIPTRKPKSVQTEIREKRWQRDMKAYKNLRRDGYQPPSIEGAALRERQATDVYDIEHRPVTVDYNDPT